MDPGVLKNLLGNPLGSNGLFAHPREPETPKTANQLSTWTLAQKSSRTAKNKKARAARRNNR